jgi:tight adherence protein B
MTLALLGLAIAVVALGVVGVSISRGRRRDADLVELLGDGATVEDLTERPTWIARVTVEAAEAAAKRLDKRGALRSALQRSGIPLQPGELVVLTALGGITLGALATVVTESLVFGAATLALAPVVASAIVKHKIKQRSAVLLDAFPDALSLVVASLNAGHTFLRAIQLLCEDVEPVLGDELARVVAECELGDPLPDALERMALRLQVRDIEWAVQAIRVQQEAGGRLAEVLQNIGDFMRSRQEVRREVSALTAEGRMSGWVLAGIPVFLLFAIQASSPGYLEPMFQGWGIVALVVSALSCVVGLRMIFKMVESIEV